MVVKFGWGWGGIPLGAEFISWDGLSSGVVERVRNVWVLTPDLSATLSMNLSKTLDFPESQFSYLLVKGIVKWKSWHPLHWWPLELVQLKCVQGLPQTWYNKSSPLETGSLQPNQEPNLAEQRFLKGQLNVICHRVKGDPKKTTTKPNFLKKDSGHRVDLLVLGWWLSLLEIIYKMRLFR